MTQNGDGITKARAMPFKIERSQGGVYDAYLQIAERVMSGEVETKQAQEGTRALNGISTLVKTQLLAMKLMDTGSTEKVRSAAANLLQLGAPKKDESETPTSTQ